MLATTVGWPICICTCRCRCTCGMYLSVSWCCSSERVAGRKSGVTVETLINLSLICLERPIHWSMMNSQPALQGRYYINLYFSACNINAINQSTMYIYVLYCRLTLNVHQYPTFHSAPLWRMWNRYWTL